MALWDLAESAAGAAWALGDHGAELARLRFRIELERLLGIDRPGDPYGRAAMNSMGAVHRGSRRFADLQYASPGKEPFAGFRFPEDLTAARRLLDLHREWTSAPPPADRKRALDGEDRDGALTLFAASVPLVLAHHRADAADFAPQLAELKVQLKQTAERMLAATAARAARGPQYVRFASRDVQEIRYVQGYFALFHCENADTWRKALPALLGEDAKGDPARLQIRAGLLEGLAAAPLYIVAPWPAGVFHEIGLTRTNASSPDDRLFALAMLDPQRLAPADRRALAAGWPERLWDLRDTFVREPDATRAFAARSVRRLTVGWTDRDESSAVDAALQDVRRRLFLHVVASQGGADAFAFSGDLSYRNWNEKDAALFNQSLLAHIAQVQATLGPRHGETQRFVKWQAELRERFPALPGPQSGEVAPLRVTRFWNPYAMT